MARPSTHSATTPARRAPNLERDKVVLAALSLLNEVGFQGMTLRKLADKLGVKAAALYWHFTNKQDLVDQVASRIIEEEFRRTEFPPNASWRELLTILAYGSRTAFMRYRDGALVIASADLSKNNAYESRDFIMSNLLAAGMPAHLVLPCICTISRYCLGAVLEEQADPKPGAERATFEETTLPEIAKTHPEMSEAYFAAKDNGQLESKIRFDAGLQFLLDGITQRVSQN